jgi:ferredoxin-NADP reductase
MTLGPLVAMARVAPQLGSTKCKNASLQCFAYCWGRDATGAYNAQLFLRSPILVFTHLVHCLQSSRYVLAGSHLLTLLVMAIHGDLSHSHVVMCGPSPLITDMRSVVRSMGVRHVHVEAFDIRTGVGPDLSREVDSLIRGLA